MSKRHHTIIYFFIFIGLIGYILPWLITPTSPLTLGAYDLAEWTSLHPSQPSTTPPLLGAFLLRLQLVIITMLIALSAQTTLTRLFSFFLVFILSLAQLPPLEFLTSATDNINYQQQFLFATISLVGGWLWIFFKPTRFVAPIAIVLSIIGLISTIYGLQEAQNLYTLSLIKHSTGIGVYLLIVTYITLGILYLIQMRRT